MTRVGAGYGGGPEGLPRSARFRTAGEPGEYHQAWLMAADDITAHAGIGAGAQDAITTLAAVAAVVPVLGGSLSTILTGYATHEAGRRFEALLADLRDEIDKVGDEKVDQAYLNSEEFLDLLIRASRIAFDTRDAEKRRWCAALLAGALTVERSDELDHEALLRVVGSLSPQTVAFARDCYVAATANVPADYRNPPVEYPKEAHGQFLLSQLRAVGLIDESTGSGWGGSITQRRVSTAFRELMEVVGVEKG